MRREGKGMVEEGFEERRKGEAQGESQELASNQGGASQKATRQGESPEVAMD